MIIPVDPPSGPAISSSSDDDSDIGIRRQFKTMRARLVELEKLYATRFQHQVPTATSVKKQPLGERCKFHLHVIVYNHADRVECATCEEPLSPIAVLREFANQERHFADQLEHLRQEKAALGQEVEALKKQRNALRSAVRKAGGKPVERWDLRKDSSE